MSHHLNNCCISCTDVGSCINKELVDIGGGLTPDNLVNFCQAVNKCVDAQLELISLGQDSSLPNFIPALEYHLRSFDGYTDTGDIYLSLSDNVFTWQPVVGGGGSYTDEEAQDAVGTILSNTSSVVFTYNDSLPSISAVVPPAFVRGLFNAGTGLSYNSSTGVFTNTATGYTDEQAQDAVGSILSSEFTYNDGAPSISLNVYSGLSKGSPVRLGQTIGAVGNPAVLVSNTEIPLADYTLALNNKTGTGSDPASVTFATGSSSGSSVSSITLSSKDATRVIHSIDDTLGNMESQYYGASGDYLGASGYSIFGSGGHFYLSDMRGGTTHTTVEVGGSISQSWLTTGDTYIGAFGTKNTGFGGITSPTAPIDVSASTASKGSIRIQPGVTPSSGYLDGLIWYDGTHAYIRISGVDRQLDNDNNFSSGDFIQNQFAGAQASANYWIDGHARVDDYLQIGTANRFATNTNGFTSATAFDDSTIGGNFAASKYFFQNPAAANQMSVSYIGYGSGGAGHIDVSAPSGVLLFSPLISFQQAVTASVPAFDMGGQYPLKIYGGNGTANQWNFLELWNNNIAGFNADALNTRLAFVGNRTTSGKTIFGRVGTEITNFSNAAYTGDLIFETVSAAINTGNPTEYMRLKHDGRLIVKSLDTDSTAPATTGTTKDVICDANGLLSFIDIPVPGSPNVPISILVDALSSNSLNVGNFTQNWEWNGLTNGQGLIMSSSTLVGGNILLISSDSTNKDNTASPLAAVFSQGVNSASNAVVAGLSVSVVNSGTSSTNIAFASAAYNADINYAAQFQAGIVQFGSATNFQDGVIQICSSAGGTITVQPPSIGSDYTLILPVDDGTLGQVLSTDGSGTLSWASVAGAQGIADVLDFNDTLTSDAAIAAASNSFGITGADDFTIEATGTTFLQVANYTGASNSDVLTLIDNTTGEVGWTAGGGGGGGTVLSVSSGNLAPFFTTSVANSTTTPAISYALTAAGAHTYWGNNTGSSTTPDYISNAAFVRVNDTNVTATLTGNPTTALLETMTLTLGWAGTLSTARGGTGLGSIGTANQLIRVNAGGTALEYFTSTYLTTAITSLNSLTGASQTFAVGTSGTDFAVSSSGTVHTFNLPDASATARGVVSTGTQIIAGAKTFNSGVVINEIATATNTRIETSGNANAVFVDSTNNRVGLFNGAPSFPVDITGNTRIASGSLGIGSSPSTAAALVVGGTAFTTNAIAVTSSITSGVGSTPSVVSIAGTIIEAGSGNHSLIAGLKVTAPIITSGLATVTDTATVYISGAPTATVTGSNNSLLVDGGNSRFNGDITLGTGASYTTGGYDLLVRNQTSGRLEIVEPDVVGFNSQSGTSYTLVIGDKGQMIRMTNAGANTLTIPPNSSVAFSLGTEILIYQEGAGQTTVAAGVGVTLKSRGNAFKLAGQDGVATLVKLATNTWVLSGDVTT